MAATTALARTLKNLTPPPMLPQMTVQELQDLLMDNEVQNFDPVAEAFKVYDPHSTGFVDSEILRSIFQNLGFGEISDEDLGILVETGDKDKDGRISLQDFRNMLAEGEKVAAASSTETAEAPKEAAPEDATEPKAGGGSLNSEGGEKLYCYSYSNDFSL